MLKFQVFSRIHSVGEEFVQKLATLYAEPSAQVQAQYENSLLTCYQLAQPVPPTGFIKGHAMCDHVYVIMHVKYPSYLL